MSEFLKPQSPLRKGESYIYPLTTEDQIIMEDGSRLSGKLMNEYATKVWVDTKLKNMNNNAPEVSDEDNGKFLQVVNGAWTAVQLPYAEEATF